MTNLIPRGGAIRWLTVLAVLAVPAIVVSIGWFGGDSADEPARSAGTHEETEPPGDEGKAMARKNGCTVAVLPRTADRAYSGGDEISPSGDHILGARYKKDGTTKVSTVWHDGEPDDLYVDIESLTGGINSDGAAVGRFDTTDGEPGVFRGGEPTPLSLAGLTDVDRVELVGINESGDVAGNVVSIAMDTSRGAPADKRVTTVVVWREGTKRPVVLDTASDTYAKGTAITEDGTVLSQDVQSGDEPVTWTCDR